MQVEILNQSKQKIIKIDFLIKWMKQVEKELKLKKIKEQDLKKKLTLSFITENRMKELNKMFRSTNKSTDVLSFSSNERGVLGELALCPTVISRQSFQNKTSIREETAYIVLHGVLHLLGYEHEKNRKKAREMFDLQDQIYFKLFKLMKKC